MTRDHDSCAHRDDISIDQTIDLPARRLGNSEATAQFTASADSVETSEFQGDTTPHGGETRDESLGTLGQRPPNRTNQQPGLPLSTIGEYTVLKELGRGGMGVVYLGFHQRLHRHVAIKMILGEGSYNDLECERFAREARAVAGLQHPNIVQLYEISEQAKTPHIVLEFVEGKSLQHAVRTRTLPGNEAAQLTLKLARALQFSHEAGILHRDVKPANILLTQANEPKLSDFGLVKNLSESDSSSTRTGTIMGSPAYMPPEQAQGRISELSPASDQYSLGATLYEMLTGRPPFSGPTLMDTVMQVITKEPVPPRDLQSNIPRDLETICLKTLSKDPRKRYASCEELARDLERFLRDEPIVARPIGKTELIWRWCKRNPALASVSFTVVVLLMAVAIASMIFSVTLARKNKELAAANTREQAAAQRATAQEKIATERADLAVGTIQSLLNEVQEHLKDTPAQQKLRQRILEIARSQLEKLPDLPTALDDQRELNQLALQQLMLTLEFELGHPERAIPYIDKALAIAKSRINKRQGSDAARANLVVVLQAIAKRYETTDRDLVRAEAYRDEALAVLQDVLAAPKAADNGKGLLPVTQVCLMLAESHIQIAVMQYRLGNPEKGATQFNYALRYCQRARSTIDHDPLLSGEHEPKKQPLLAMLSSAEIRAKLGAARFGLHLEQSQTAIETLKTTVAEVKRMWAARPTPETQFLLLGALGILFDAQILTHQIDASTEATLEESLALSAKAIEQDPANAENQRLHSLNLYRQGVLFEIQASVSDSQRVLEECWSIRKKLYDAAPLNAKWRLLLMLAEARTGRISAAKASIDAIANDTKSDPESLVEAARASAQCSLHAHSSADQDMYRAQAIALLDSARQRGYRDTFLLQNEPDLGPIKDAQGGQVSALPLKTN